MSIPYPYLVRQHQKSDMGFIVDSWTESWHGSTMREVRYRYFRDPCRARINDIVRRNYVLVACDPENPDHIFGYIVYNPESRVVHYMYVTVTRRKTGLARELFQKALGEFTDLWFFTHLTRVGYKLAHTRGGEYNPCLLWYIQSGGNHEGKGTQAD